MPRVLNLSVITVFLQNRNSLTYEKNKMSITFELISYIKTYNCQVSAIQNSKKLSEELHELCILWNKRFYKSPTCLFCSINFSNNENLFFISTTAWSDICYYVLQNTCISCQYWQIIITAFFKEEICHFSSSLNFSKRVLQSPEWDKPCIIRINKSKYEWIFSCFMLYSQTIFDQCN